MCFQENNFFFSKTKSLMRNGIFMNLGSNQSFKKNIIKKNRAPNAYMRMNTFLLQKITFSWIFQRIKRRSIVFWVFYHNRFKGFERASKKKKKPLVADLQLTFVSSPKTAFKKFNSPQSPIPQRVELSVPRRAVPKNSILGLF